MNRRKSRKTPAVDLVPFLSTPTGGQAARCQAVKRDGKQCGAPARVGFEVCAKHGAGTAVRVARGDRRPPGRPVVHGLYSQRSLRSVHEIVAELEAIEIDLDDTDGEMRVLRATLAFLLQQAPQQEALAEAAERVTAVLNTRLQSESLATGDALVLGRAVGEASRLLRDAGSWSDRVADVARSIVLAVKQRAETRARMADAKALDSVARFARIIRHIMWDMLDEDQLDVLEERLQREVFAPNGLELPPPSEDGLEA